MKKIAINASNLHVGGGVQVACSFLHELSVGDFELESFYFFVSTIVDINLKGLNSPICKHLNYKVINTNGIRSFLSSLNKELINFDVVFTVFGPSYFVGLKGVAIEGFARPWIIDNCCFKFLSTRAVLSARIRLFVQKMFFQSADKLIVELEHVKDRLIDLGVAENSAIDVVYNTVSSIYSTPDDWTAIDFEPSKESAFTLGYLTRDYLHKNVKILPEVKSILQERHSLNVEFVVTFTEQEWLTNTKEFQSSITNAGALSVSQCPSFYQKIDGVIFPSLLECFSATPIEAMVMEKPLFSSDRRFVKDVCGDYAYYFDPLSAESIAEIIANYVLNTFGKDAEKLKEARLYATGFSSPSSRAEQYIGIIESAIAH